MGICWHQLAARARPCRSKPCSKRCVSISAVSRTVTSIHISQSRPKCLVPINKLPEKYHEIAGFFPLNYHKITYFCPLTAIKWLFSQPSQGGVVFFGAKPLLVDKVRRSTRPRCSTFSLVGISSLANLRRPGWLNLLWRPRSCWDLEMEGFQSHGSCGEGTIDFFQQLVDLTGFGQSTY